MSKILFLKVASFRKYLFSIKNLLNPKDRKIYRNLKNFKFAI